MLYEVKPDLLYLHCYFANQLHTKYIIKVYFNFQNIIQFEQYQRRCTNPGIARITHFLNCYHGI